MASHGIPKSSGNKPISEAARKKELQKIENYQILVGEVNDQIKAHRFTIEVLDLTSKLLKINPEYYTIWNHRRRIIQHILSPNSTESQSHTSQTAKELISNDLNFLVPLLRKYPKCYWIWNYRLWLLKEATRLLPPADSHQFWQQELTLVSKMLNLDSRNFHGWGYRRAVIAALESSSQLDTEPPKSLTEQEFNYTTRMIETNLSNFSAWHNRSKLLPRLLTEKSATPTDQQKALTAELHLLLRALYADSTDQSLWSYHQYLTSAFSPPHSRTSIAPHLTPTQRLHHISTEAENLTEMLDGADEGEGRKWILLALIQLACLRKSLSGEWGERGNCTKEWIGEVRRLDPMRGGRWDDLERELDAL